MVDLTVEGIPPDVGQEPMMDMFAADQAKTEAVPRDPPEVDEKRKRLISAWTNRIKRAKTHWKPAFDRMKEDQDFCFGKQWSKKNDDSRYVANLTLRLVAQKTAFLYAKNPKAIARKRERMNMTSWDGKEATLQQVAMGGSMMMQQMQGMVPPEQQGMMAADVAQQGMPPMNGANGPPMPGAGPPMGGGLGDAMGGMMEGGAPPTQPGMPGAADPMSSAAAQMSQMPGMNPMLQQAIGQGMDIAQDAARVKSENAMIDKLCKTMELLYQYQVSEQVHPFKSMMKLTVRRAVTTGVGYVKLGFERAMGQRPDIEKGIADAAERLSTLERLAADQQDEITDEHSKEAEQLGLLIADLKKTPQIVVREGLTYDYPLSGNIIPDPKCHQLRHWLGADWVAEEFLLSASEVQEIYGKDIGDKYSEYSRDDLGGGPDPVSLARSWGSSTVSEKYGWDDNKRDEKAACVWEIFSRKDGLVYVVCDGYEDFLREPASPEIYNERFYPWYPLVLNECDNENELFPPSDVRLMRDMQKEYNRCREGLKEQRIAARPFIAVVAGSMDEGDLDKLSEREANAIVELNALQPNQDIKSLLQSYAGSGIDNNLYEVNPIFDDLTRTTGIQEANLGGTSDTTATQTQVSEASRQTAMGSNIDDLNDLLTELARNGGQILLREMSIDQVKRVIGVGAVWPEMDQQQIADEIALEIEAGSMGRPNAAAEVANAQRIYPLLIQLPGIDPEFLAKDLLRRLDDRLDLTQAFKSQLPSIVAMNSAGAGGAVPGTGAPSGAAQGPQGAMNAPMSEQPAPTGGPDPTQQLTGAPPGSQTLQ